MTWLDGIQCLRCNFFYNETKKQCLGTCTHQICSSCKEKLLNANCPICGAENAFKETIFNYEAREAGEKMMKEIDGSTIISCMKKEEKSAREDLYSGPCFECKGHAKILRICTDCAQGAGLIREIHHKLYLRSETCEEKFAFLKAKTASICAECILKGNHQNHKIDLLRNVNLMGISIAWDNALTLREVALRSNWYESTTKHTRDLLHQIKTYALTNSSERILKEMNNTKPFEYPSIVPYAKLMIIKDLQRERIKMQGEIHLLSILTRGRTMHSFRVAIQQCRNYMLRSIEPNERAEIGEYVKELEDACATIKMDDVTMEDMKAGYTFAYNLVDGNIERFEKLQEMPGEEFTKIQQEKSEQKRQWSDKQYRLLLKTYEQLAETLEFKERHDADSSWTEENTHQYKEKRKEAEECLCSLCDAAVGWETAENDLYILLRYLYCRRLIILEQYIKHIIQGDDVTTRCIMNRTQLKEPNGPFGRLSNG